ncbi:uncharacterized protein LOC113779639 isoform X2 [Coffea eugenioides]|uniref:uncharacterized protein LOC113779639 isoform X2 n=1 Tax=Coffea eugenioides TaxID=49369 RepID=UPI000F612686|nr:uncharacterized protein LOC113779639 isoform X2 [Coffea eugenioides]
MSEGEYDNSSGDPSEKLRTLKITSLDEEEDEEDAPMVDDVYEEEDDDEEEEEGEEPVSLGFVESPKHSWSLSRELFPSVAGGTPAWLDPTNLPSGRSCLCDFCAQPLQFLLQVYAPLLHKESTFHRTLFVFICPSMSCLLKDQHDQWKRQPEKAFRSVKVFRCQLPRFNSFYSSEPPRHDGSDRRTRNGAILCSWCGTWRGDKICSNCRIARYCSEKHQTAHWRSGHKIECRQPYMAPVASASTISDLPAETQKGTIDWQKPNHYGPYQVAGHQKWIFQGATIVVGLELVNSRYCRNYYITLELKIMQILLIGQLLWCIRAKPRVRIELFTRKNLPGFSFYLNQLQHCDKCYDPPVFSCYLCFRFCVNQRETTIFFPWCTFLLSPQGISKDARFMNHCVSA